ncbi:PhoX family phosphatase [Undibacterium seohonense]|uniref:PhoX family phosphatase n=1 Tax=Undibacterium seohonense TaxID=1344950 RepID=A0ABR6X0D3_9BURK|nr:PhoX family phosphatase [Undibacterium seohonense]MBC3806231.1 PhoX family phosphatase [Undibacterium seohonense]
MSKSNDKALSFVDPDDIGNNHSNNEHFSAILDSRLSRRSLLRGGAASIASAFIGSSALSACGSNDTPVVVTPEVPKPVEKLLGFAPVAKSLLDSVIVPVGYTASAIYALGDPLTASTAAYRNDGTDTDYENRAGDHHDGMEWFGLSADGKASLTSVERGLLGVNHEATTNEKQASFFLHANGGTSSLPRPASEVDKETAIHGVSFVEVRKANGKWEYVKDSSFNRRFTCLTEMELSGPVRGNALAITKYSATGQKTRGTLNNCGTGKTPWNSFVTGEENWAGYFTRNATDDTARVGEKSIVALKRYGSSQGLPSRHGWETGGTEDKYVRWNISKTGSSTNGSDDYRNEMNGMGYIVEMDAYDKTKLAKKRTALGRFAHESAAFGKPVAGKPLAVYMGDDSRNEYIYKYVSTANWDAADANSTNPLATGDKYLDSGKLYVAQFNADGSGKWIELSLSNAQIAAYANYKFADQADICVNSRLAGDAVGATKMDRPEWCSVNPANGEIYYSLTNNSNRNVNATGSSQLVPDSANPRAYTDMKGTTAQNGNPNGHILRMKEGTDGSAALTFTWDVYLFAAEASADAGKINLSSLTNDQDMSSPDGLAFSPATGICWIQTDDGAFTDVTNCMMLAGLPGQVGDGEKVTLNYTKTDGTPLAVTTYVGKKPTADTLKRFLVGPVGCELTGIAETPDGKALFVNIQHPGETTAAANIADPTKYTSQWPANTGYGLGKRPRSATIVITKNDGGRIGS